MTDSVTFRWLDECPEVVPTIAGWHFDEWGHLRAVDSIAARVAKLEHHLRANGIPRTVVAFRDGRPVGSAALVAHDLPDRTSIGPWLAAVYVEPEQRRRGVGSALVERVVGEARRQGMARLFLFTWDQERLYAGLGWALVDRVDYDATSVAVMTIRTGAPLRREAQ